MREKVLVVPKSFLFSGQAILQGFQRGRNWKLIKRIAAGSFFIPRHEAEKEPHYKQIITYLVLTHQNSVFLYQRIDASSEKRLLFKHSLGLGGHINPGPARSFKELIALNLNRELREEIFLKGSYSHRFLGIVNDEETGVGKCHLGLVFLVTCSSAEAEIKEKGKLTGSFVPVSRLSSYQPCMESWSALLLPEISKIISGGGETGEA
ncbi:MAG: hypothetical protein HPY58_01360 [Firmicutes bacterium]|nr:hypothetical protein [Bacillota bacterium]